MWYHIAQRHSWVPLCSVQCSRLCSLRLATHTTSTTWSSSQGQLHTPYHLHLLPPPLCSLQLWDATHPTTVVAGLHCDRLTAESLLHQQPPGTFICRLSLGQPGSLIISCKVPEVHPHAGTDGVTHAVITNAQLRQRRVDGWLRVLGDASHVLDACTGRRVDKRQVIEQDYVTVGSIAHAVGAAAHKQAARQPEAVHQLAVHQNLVQQQALLL